MEDTWCRGQISLLRIAQTTPITSVFCFTESFCSNSMADILTSLLLRDQGVEAPRGIQCLERKREWRKMLLCVSRLIILNAVFSLFQFLQTPMRFVLGALLYRRGTAIGGIGHRREWHLTLVLQVEHSDPGDFYPRDVSRHCNTLSSIRHTCS